MQMFRLGRYLLDEFCRRFRQRRVTAQLGSRFVQRLGRRRWRLLIRREGLLHFEVCGVESFQLLACVASHRRHRDLVEYKRPFTILALGDRSRGINQAWLTGQLHLGVDQEVAGGGDAFAGLQSVKNDNLVCQDRTNRNRANLKSAGLGLDIDDTVAARQQHCGARHMQ